MQTVYRLRLSSCERNYFYCYFRHQHLEVTTVVFVLLCGGWLMIGFHGVVDT